MSLDDDLRAAERAGDDLKVAAIRKRLGDGDTQALLLEFKREVEKLEQENREHGYAIKRNEARIEFLRRCAKAIVGDPCSSCNGQGVIREWVYQDESNLVKCSTCGGKGFKG